MVGADGCALLRGQVLDRDAVTDHRSAGQLACARGLIVSVAEKLVRILLADKTALDADLAIMPEGNDGACERKRPGGPDFRRACQSIDALLEFGQTVLVGVVAVDEFVVFLRQTVKSA